MYEAKVYGGYWQVNLDADMGEIAKVSGTLYDGREWSQILPVVTDPSRLRYMDNAVCIPR
jgi:hypothetical protein